MKKIVTFLMVCMAAGAFAATLKPAKQVSAPTVQPRQQVVAKSHVANLPQFTQEEIAQFQAKYPVQMSAFNTHKKAHAIRKAALADPKELKLQGDGAALFLGTYLEIIGYSYQYYWSLEFDNVALEFFGASNNRLVGYYKNAYCTVMEGTDTIDTEGSLRIAYKAAGEEGYSPVYTIEGTFKDDKGNVYHISDEYSFMDAGDENDAVFDYGMYMACYFCYYGKTDYCEFCTGDYEITLSDQPVTPTGVILPIALDTLATQYYSETKDWVISGKSDNALFGIDIFTDNLIGEFDETDIDMAYTYLEAVDGSDTTVIDLYAVQKATITGDKQTMNCTFEIMGYDGNIYQITGTYNAPVFTDTVDVIMMGDLYDFIDEEGFVQIYGSCQTEGTLLSLAFYTDKIIGSYTEKNTVSGGKYDQVGIIVDNKQYIYKVVNYKMNIVPGTGTLAGYYICEAYVNCSNSLLNDKKCFHVLFLATVYDPYAYDENENVNLTYEVDDISKYLITQTFEQYGLAALRVQTDSSQLMLYILPEKLTEGGMLPNGTYPIDFSEKAPSILASNGYDDEYYSDGAYYMVIRDKYYHIWYLTSGEMIVSDNKIELKATNSKGAQVNITINYTSVGLKEIMENANNRIQKMMYKGHLMILHNNRMFNAQGLQMR